jgi:hypothetical protein
MRVRRELERQGGRKEKVEGGNGEKGKARKGGRGER